MRHITGLLVAVAVSGCGGAVSPEVYALVVDALVVPASCFITPPAGMVTKAPLGTTTVTVWDGPDGKAYLSPDGTFAFSMGDAPTVGATPSNAIEGTAGAEGWVFVQETDVTQVLGLITTRTENQKTRLELTFPRAATGTGKLSLSSSSTCTGTGCPADSTSCSISGLPVRVTKLAVDFQRTP